MRKLIIIILSLLSILAYAKKADLSGYKYVKLYHLENDPYGMTAQLKESLKKKGFAAYYDYTELSKTELNEISDNPCLVIYLSDATYIKASWGGQARISFNLVNCNDIVVFNGREVRHNVAYNEKVIPNLANQAIKSIARKGYDKSKTPKSSIIDDKFNRKVELESVDINDVKLIKDYFDRYASYEIEGIWETPGELNNLYRVGIIKKGDLFEAFIMETDAKSGFWENGDLKATFEPMAVENMYSVRWIMQDKRTVKKSIAKLSQNARITFKINDSEFNIYKLYPN